MPSSIINSDDGVVSGTAGLKTSGGDDGVLEIQNNGTAQAKVTAAGLLQFNSGYGSVATAYGCRAWVNFNGTGTVAIREDGNVSSITDNGTGNYTINFTNALTDANYSIVGACSRNASEGYEFFSIQGTSNMTTSSAQVVTRLINQSLLDQTTVCVAIFR